MRKNVALMALISLVAIVLGEATVPARGATTTVTYSVQDLGTLPGDYASAAWGINQFGDIVGWSMGPTGPRAFVYRNGAGMTALPAPTGRPVTTARAISATGVVVGTAATGGSDIGHAVRWRSGIPQDLGTLAGGNVSEARSVNASGTIVGTSDTNGGSLYSHAFRYTDAAGMVDLTPSIDNAHAEGINDAGQVTGWRNGRAFRLTGTTFADLGVPTGYAASFGFAVNAGGQVAGHVISGSGNAERIFRYTAGAMVILGGLGEYNRAWGINSAGDIVGEGTPVLGLKQGFVYTDANGMRGLNQLIDPASGWFILGATSINDAGQIVGWASGPTGQRAVLLTPGGPQTPPAAPSGLVGTALPGASVRLNWTDNANDEVGFRIQRARGWQGDFVLIGQIGANVTTFIDATAQAGKLYRYRVRAFNDAGLSPWSNTVRIRARR
jgi:probable HAF family extracellular repeat protein